MAVLAGTGFFTVEVLSWRGLVTYYVLFLLQLETRRVALGGISTPPRNGSLRWLATLLTRRPAASVDVRMCCMAVMPTGVNDFHPFRVALEDPETCHWLGNIV
jgi:hypothetical protein